MGILIVLFLILAGISLVFFHRGLYSFLDSKAKSERDKWWLGSPGFFRFRAIGLGIALLALGIGGLYRLVVDLLFK